MIDIDKIENRGDWTNDYKVRLFWDLVTEVKRLHGWLNDNDRCIMCCGEGFWIGHKCGVDEE